MSKKVKKKRGNCYATSEAIWHLLGGHTSGYSPRYVKHEGDTHWFLIHRETYHILDLTVSQFQTRPPYEKSKGCGFLTKKPSKKALALMEILVWQNNS